MAIEARAFLSLEDTVRRPVEEAVRDVLEDPLRRARNLVDRGDYDEAAAVLQGADVRSALDDARADLRVALQQALVVGSAQIVDPEDSVFMRRLPASDVVGAGVETMLNTVVSIIETGVIPAAINAVERMRAEEREVAKRDRQSMHHRIGALFGSHVHQHEEVRKNALADALNDAVARGTRLAPEIGANLVTSRLVTYGFLVEATENTITTYQVEEILDERICPVCELMHGRTFEVTSAVERIERLILETDPGTLKAVAPFWRQDKESIRRLSNMRQEELVEAGMDTPPYHPLCRGILVMAGQATDITTRRHPIPPPPEPASVPAEPPPLPEYLATRAGHEPFVSITDDLGAVHRDELTALRPAFRKADDEVAEAIRRTDHTSGVRINEGGGGSWYTPGESTITMTSRYGAKLDDAVTNSTFMSVFRHEYGHHVDAMAARVVPRTQVSPADGDNIQFLLLRRQTNHASAEAADEIADEGRAIAKGMQTRPARAKREDAVIARAQARVDEIDDALPATATTADAADYVVEQMAAKYGFTVDDYMRVVGEGKGRSVIDAVVIESAIEERVATTLAYRLGAGTNGTLNNWQDFIGAVTRNRVKLPFGHATSYYTRQGAIHADGVTPDMASEAFANWFDARGSGNTFVQFLYRHFAPKTTERFDEIIAAMATREG